MVIQGKPVLRVPIFITCCLTICVLWSQLALAILRVPTDYETIQAAIDAADHGDTVLIAPGEYSGSIDFQAKQITVSSLFLITSMREYIDSTKIIGTDDVSVISFSSQEDHSSRLCGVTVKGGRSGFGAGIYCGENSSPTIEYCRITDNIATGLGGAIIAWQNSTPLLRYCEIYGNGANTGAGLVCRGDSRPILVNCVLTENRAANDAGGIYCLSGGMPIVINSILWNNYPEEVLFKDTGRENAIILAYCSLRAGVNGVVTEDNGEAEVQGGLIADDPRFADPERNLFNLEWNSPCIDAGTTIFQIDGDTLLHMNEDQFLGESVEIGAHEFDPNYAPPYPDTTIQSFFLQSIYPNPVNGIININFSLLSAGYTLINLYDTNGRLIDRLQNSPMPTGHHTVTKNLESLNSGCYVLEVVSSGDTQTRNLMVIK